MVNVKFYEQQLTSMGLIVSKTGEVSSVVDNDGNTEPVMCGSRALVLPTKKYLKANDWTNHIPYHPVCESAIRKESIVHKFIRRLATVRISHVFESLAHHLIYLGANTAEHKKLNTTQKMMLCHIPKADEKCVKLLDKVFAATDISDPNKRIISLWLKDDGVITIEGEDKAYKKACMVSFPFIEQIADNMQSFMGIKCSKTTAMTLMSLFNYMLTDISVPNQYSVGSNDKHAPAFVSISLAFTGVMSRLNDILEMIGDTMDEGEYESLYRDLSWCNDLSGIAKLRAIIPPLDGNIGETIDGEVETPPEAPAKTKAAPMRGFDQAGNVESSPPSPTPNQPTNIREEEVKPKTDELPNWRDVYQAPSQPQGYQQPPQYPQPPVGYQPPPTQQYQQPAPPQHGYSQQYPQHAPQFPQYGYPPQYQQQLAQPAGRMEANMRKQEEDSKIYYANLAAQKSEEERRQREMMAYQQRNMSQPPQYGYPPQYPQSAPQYPQHPPQYPQYGYPPQQQGPVGNAFFKQ